MRDRLIRPQWVIVRPLKPQQGDVFGDSEVLLSKTRAAGFRMKIQLTWSARSRFMDGVPGRQSNQSASAMIRLRDVPYGTVWIPNTNDVVELLGAAGETVSLFVDDVQPAFPRRASLHSPNGGFDGWRVTLVDRFPTASAATQYE